MRAFITVGSTKFDALIQHAFSEEVVDSLKRHGYTELFIQCGNSAFTYASRVAGGEYALELDGIQIEVWKFKPSLDEEYEKVDLVISHAGETFTALNEGSRVNRKC